MVDNIQQHLAKLKNYAPPGPLAGVNKIYFLKVLEKPGQIKVGDTHGEVKNRNDQTITNASLHTDGDTIFVPAFKHDGSTYRDKKFHAFLRKKGYKFELNNNKNQSEWVYASPSGEPPTVELLLEELSEFTGKPVYKTAVLRTAQKYLLDLQQEAIDAGHQYINAGYCVRVGKTIISLTQAANNNWMPVYIGKNLTSQSSAEADNAEFGIVPEILTQSLHGFDELEDGDLSKKTKQIIKNINKTNVSDRPIIFFVDEVDDASHTARSRAIITPLVEHFKVNGKFACIVTMSGTRIYRGEKILRELTDGDIKELSLEYYEMQILQPETTCRRNYRHISFYAEKADGLVNISDAMKNKDNGHRSLATCVEKLLGTNNFQIDINDDFPHWFMKFATVGKDDANKLVKYLNRNHSVIEDKQFFFSVINGDTTKSREAQDYCKKIIADNAGKTCVFISQGMATTSFSVSGIGNSVVFTDNEITSDDTQALHRSATWAPGKTDCNMVVITTNDSRDYAFDDIFEDEVKRADGRGEKIELYKELLTNNSMVHFHEAHGFRPVVVTQDNAADVIDKKMRSMTKAASFMNLLRDMDEDLLDAIYTTVTGKGNTNRKSGQEKADDFDPFGKGKQKKEAKKKETGLTNSKKEAILRAFAENAVLVPALAREQETTIQDFEFWNEASISQDLFFTVYNTSPEFRDRIDTIYGLCQDDEYLVTTYIDKLTV